MSSQADVKFRFPRTVTFDDVLLVPQLSSIESRSSIDVSVDMKNVGKLSLPIVSSPMDTVTGSSMARELGKRGILSILHRYNTQTEQTALLSLAVGEGARITGAAVGVTGDFMQRVRSLVAMGVDVICLDIAHGHHEMMRSAIHQIRKEFSSLHIMAGNVATREAFEDLSDWGADSVRVGIGGGSICSTRIKTGHGVPTLQSVLDCAQSDRDAMIVADGGIRTSGDVVKALAAGADLVMLGSMLAGTDESPGDVVEIPTTIGGGQAYTRYKAYRGMASVEAQIEWRGHTSSVEGVSSKVPYKGPVSDSLEMIENGIRSGLSYTGANNIKHFQSKAKFIRQTNAGLQESKTHIHNL